MDPNHSVTAHANRLKMMAEELKSVNAPVTDAILIMRILQTLPPSFDVFQIIWNTVPSIQQTVANLIARLVTEEQRLRTRMRVLKPRPTQHSLPATPPESYNNKIPKPRMPLTATTPFAEKVQTSHKIATPTLADLHSIAVMDTEVAGIVAVEETAITAESLATKKPPAGTKTKRIARTLAMTTRTKDATMVKIQTTRSALYRLYASLHENLPTGTPTQAQPTT
jgi:hypothetical protein